MFVVLVSVFTAGVFDRSLASNTEGRIKYVAPNNQLFQARPTLLNINTNQPLYYPFTSSVNKCAGSCSTISDLYVENMVQMK